MQVERTQSRAGLMRLDEGQVCRGAEGKSGCGGTQEENRKQKSQKHNPPHNKPTSIEEPQNTHELKYTSNNYSLSYL